MKSLEITVSMKTLDSIPTKSEISKIPVKLRAFPEVEGGYLVRVYPEKDAPWNTDKWVRELKRELSRYGDVDYVRVLFSFLAK